MWRPAVVTTAPAAEPVTTAELVTHCRAPEDGTDDVYLAAIGASARSHVEGLTATRLVTQTVTFKTDAWADLANLPIAPVQSITSITYTDTAGNPQTVSTDVYEARLEGLEPAIVLKYGQAWPSSRPGSLVTVTAVVGYGAAGDQPDAVLHAIKLIVGDMYANRETVLAGSAASLPVSATVDALLCNHRKHLI